MNVELVASMSGDYLDLNLSSNKHSTSRLGRQKIPFAASRHQLLIGLFSPADETSLGERGKKMSKRRVGGEGRWEKSLLMILRFNYFCKYRKPGLHGDPVSRFFISRAAARCRVADVPPAAIRE